MDMDIPLPEELELLEADSRLHDPYLDSEFDPCEEIPPDSPPPPQKDAHKRPRSNCLDSQIEDAEFPSDDKRSRIDVANGSDEEENWLRYVPRKESDDTGGAEERREAALLVEEKEKILSKYAFEIVGDVVPVTAPGGGDRVYAKICRVENEERVKKLEVKSHSEGLTSDPINVLLQKVEQEAFTKALNSSFEGQNEVSLPEKPAVHQQLWVDKYAPHSFTELLSDEQTNREVLLWLKQWDPCVFGSDIRSTPDEVLSALRRHSSTTLHHKSNDFNSSRKSSGDKWSSGSFRYSNNLVYENNNSKDIQDLLKRKTRITSPPEQKILLLCGPPGLGKTTLAHVAAKHCGYHVIEVNASDDRSSSTIESKILDVVQMNSVTADSRPKCLVIDEIDGALSDGKGAVEVILKLVSAERKSATGKENIDKEEQSGNAISKKGRKPASLLRPVICICNDLYAAALRPLRQIAKVHVFVQPTVSRVVSRLKYICNNEGMRASSISLTVLAEYTECDIRSCLNTLQFLNKKKETLNVMEIGSQVVGRKDMSKSAFDIWKEIFQKRKTKQLRKSSNSSGSTFNEFDFLHSLISNRGDYDVILDGVHENLLHLQYHDPVMEKTVKCLNCLVISDIMNQYVMRTQQMPLHVYQPSLAITVHRLVAQIQKPSIEWPKSYHRFRSMVMEKIDLLKSWKYRISPYISRHLSTKTFVEDSVSPLLHILSPPTLRPVVLHLLSEKEKRDLAQLVSAMVSYSITYKNRKPDLLPSNLVHEAAPDALTLSLDPPITDFINFKGYKSDHHALGLAVKQVLVHEVEKQRIMQVGATKSLHMSDAQKEDHDSVGKKTSKANPFKTDQVVTFADTAADAKVMLNSRQSNLSLSTAPSTSASSRSTTASLKSKCAGAMKKPSNGLFSFFERVKKVGSKSSEDIDDALQKPATAERDSRPLIFKFNEGFTNAVKRPVRVHEFLL